MGEHPSRTRRPRTADWAVGAVVVLLHLAPVRVGQAEVAIDGVWAALLTPVLALGTGLPLAWRRESPRPVSALVLVSLAGLTAIQGVVPPWSGWVLTWSLATSRSPRRAALWQSASAASATIAILGVAALLTREPGALVLLAGMTAVVALAGLLVRSERDRVREAERRAAIEERLRIARDLHDLVGHGLSAVAVQSSTARLAMDAGDVGAARDALSAVESTSRTAIMEMRQLLDVLTDQDGRPARLSPSHGVVDVAALVENVRAGGVDVVLESTGSWDEAAPSVQLCAYRVVQEALTNALKHAPGAPVAVRLAVTGDTGLVWVQSAGLGRAKHPGGRPGGLPHWRPDEAGLAEVGPDEPGLADDHADEPGRGLAGLRTRVAAFPGEFWSGPTPQGWLVEARLPLRGGEAG